MRFSLVLLSAALLAAPALAFDLMELKSGKLIPVEEARLENGKVHVRVATEPGQTISTAIPIDRILPEFVFFVWEKQLPEGDRDAHLELAEWSRKQGLFGLALRVYEATGKFDEGVREDLPNLVTVLREEEATWQYERAEELFKRDEVRDARILVEGILERFKDSKETGRALELLGMIDERDKFLTEERRQKEQARRVERQRREVRTQAARIAQGDAYAESAKLRYVAEARWRLRWAGELYDGAAAELSAMLPFVEDETLRAEIERLLDATAGRIRSNYLRLADLRYLSGDLGAALDAAHRVLDVDPENAGAAGLRDRILDGPGPVHIRRDRGFLTYRRRAYYPFWDGLGGFGIWHPR